MTAQNKKYINGFEVNKIVSDENLIRNITRDDKVYLETVTCGNASPYRWTTRTIMCPGWTRVNRPRRGADASEG